MELIFLDLEFNQCSPNRKDLREDFIQNEIIQIGLIKTDLLLNPIRTFTTYVKLEQTNWLNKNVSELTGITLKDLNKKGKKLSWIIEHLKESTFNNVKYLITWGNADVNILKDNCIKKNINCDFLNDIEVIDAQKAYGSLNKINYDMSLTKACGDFDFYSHHNALHDVCRLIEICKREGIFNIINKKNLITYQNSKSKLINMDCVTSKDIKIFKRHKYGVLNRYLCDCGEKVYVFIESNIYEVDSDLRKRYLLKCGECNKKYYAKTTITKKLNKNEHTFETKECSDEYYFTELNNILSSKDFII